MASERNVHAVAAMHRDVEPLAFLLGSWRGEGKGEYPTIEPFAYREEVTFSHNGKPFVAYVQRTWALDDDRPLHAECGYLRTTAGGGLELVVAHPTGIAEVAVGTQLATSIDLATTSVVGTASAKRVTALERRITVDGDVLRYRVAMAAVGYPLTHHLAAELHRQ